MRILEQDMTTTFILPISFDLHKSLWACSLNLLPCFPKLWPSIRQENEAQILMIISHAYYPCHDFSFYCLQFFVYDGTKKLWKWFLIQFDVACSIPGVLPFLSDTNYLTFSFLLQSIFALFLEREAIKRYYDRQ